MKKTNEDLRENPNKTSDIIVLNQGPLDSQSSVEDIQMTEIERTYASLCLETRCPHRGYMHNCLLKGPDLYEGRSSNPASSSINQSCESSWTEASGPDSTVNQFEEMNDHPLTTQLLYAPGTVLGSFPRFTIVHFLLNFNKGVETSTYIIKVESEKKSWKIAKTTDNLELYLSKLERNVRNPKSPLMRELRLKHLQVELNRTPSKFFQLNSAWQEGSENEVNSYALLKLECIKRIQAFISTDLIEKHPRRSRVLIYVDAINNYFIPTRPKRIQSLFILYNLKFEIMKIIKLNTAEVNKINPDEREDLVHAFTVKDEKSDVSTFSCTTAIERNDWVKYLNSA